VPFTARPITNTFTASDGVNTVSNQAGAFTVLTQTLTLSGLSTGSTPAGGGVAGSATGTNFTANQAISLTLVATGTTTAVATNTVAIVADANGNFSASPMNITVPAGQAPGIYEIMARDANGLAATATNPITVTSSGTATSGTSLGLVVANGVGNACALPSGASVSIVGNAYADNGQISSAVGTPDKVIATASGPYTNGETVNFYIGTTNVGHGTFLTSTGSVVAVTFGLTTTQLSPGLYTISAIGSTSGQVATNMLAVCPPTEALANASGVQITTPVTVTGSGFGAGEAVSGTIYPLSATTPVTFGVGAPNVTQVYTVPAASNGTFSAVFTPTAFGVYVLRSTGVETTTTAKTTDLFTTTVFTVTSGPITNNGPVFPTQSFVLNAASGFKPGETVSIVPAGGVTTTAVVSSTGGFAATATAPANTPVGPLTVTIISSFGTVTTTVGITVPTASLIASPSSVPLGGSTVVTGSGFIPNQGVTLTTVFSVAGALVNAGGPVVTTTASSAGTFTVTYPVSPSVAVVGGNYWIMGVSAASTQNSATTPVTITNLSPTTPGGVPSGQATTIYFAEGYTGRFATNGRADFDEYISVLNPDNFAKTVTFTYQLQSGAAAVMTSTTVPANSDILHLVNGDVGNDQIVSAIVSSDGRIAAERIINRTAPTGKLDASSSLGSTAPATTWYFAEGYTGASFQEYLTVQNPGTVPASVTVTFLPQSVPAATPRTTSFTVPANGRWTENIRRDYLPYSDKSVGMAVTSSSPIVAERVEYWGDGVGSAKFGADAAPGMAGPAKQYFFAYGSDPGATASNAGPAQTANDESYVTIINPAPVVNGVPPSDATVLVSFFSVTGSPLGSKSITVSPQTRETVVVNNVIAPVSGPFYTAVSSDQPIFVERPQFIGGSPNAGAHPGLIPSGSPAGLTSVLFPNVNTGTASGASINETVFLLNTGASSITVNGTYYTPNSQTVSVAYTVPAGQIVVVNVNADAGNLPVGPLGAQFTTANGQFVATRIAYTPDGLTYVGTQGVNNQ